MNKNFIAVNKIRSVGFKNSFINSVSMNFIDTVVSQINDINELRQFVKYTLRLRWYSDTL